MNNKHTIHISTGLATAIDAYAKDDTLVLVTPEEHYGYGVKAVVPFERTIRDAPTVGASPVPGRASQVEKCDVPESFWAQRIVDGHQYGVGALRAT